MQLISYNYNIMKLVIKNCGEEERNRETEKRWKQGKRVRKRDRKWEKGVIQFFDKFLINNTREIK